MQNKRSPNVKKASKSRRRLSASDSRDHILWEALKLISQKGWQSVTFGSIAKRAKISPANVVYHFQSKADLFQAILKLVTKNNHEIVDRATTRNGSTLDRITEHFRLNLEWAAQYPLEAHVIVCVYQEACTDAKMSATLAEILRVARGRLKKLILEGIKKGEIGPQLKPEACATMLHNLLVGEFIAQMGTRMASGPTRGKYLVSIQTVLKCLLKPS